MTWLHVFPSTVQCMPLLFQPTLPTFLIPHAHIFSNAPPLNGVPRSLHYLYCICIEGGLVLDYRWCLFIIVDAYSLSCPIQIRPPASQGKQSARLVNYSACIVHYKYSFAFTHNIISKELKDRKRPKVANTKISYIT